MPCTLARGGNGLEATPLPWTGSSDLVGLAQANGMIALPSDGGRYESGDEVEVVER